MTEEERYFADLCRQSGATAPDFARVARRPLERVTAAVISKPTLVMVTLRLQSLRGPQVEASRTESFELPDRSGLSVRALTSKLGAFTERHQVGEVFLRSMSENGEYAGHPWNFKIEALLQQCARVWFVNTHSIGAWARREKPELPGCPHWLAASWSAKHASAAETALFAAEHRGQSRFFSDGSARA